MRPIKRRLQKKYMGIFEETHKSGFEIRVYDLGQHVIVFPHKNLFLWDDGQWHRDCYSTYAFGVKAWPSKNAAINFLDKWWNKLKPSQQDRYLARNIAYRMLNK